MSKMSETPNFKKTDAIYPALGILFNRRDTGPRVAGLIDVHLDLCNYRIHHL
jgi:hypothetical protein